MGFRMNAGQVNTVAALKEKIKLIKQRRLLLKSEERMNAKLEKALAKQALQRFKTLKEIQGDAIIARLDLMLGNQVKTATSLGIGVRTLQRWLKDLGVSAEHKSSSEEPPAKDSITNES